MHKLEISAETPHVDRIHVQEEKEASADKSWDTIPTQAQNSELAHVKIYLDEFIGVVKEAPEVRRQMKRRLFDSVYELFLLDNPLGVERE